MRKFNKYLHELVVYMQYIRVPLMRSWQFLNQLFCPTPYLPNEYNLSDYACFMRNETFLYTPRYAKHAVVIHNEQVLRDATLYHGAILAPVHYGSFFLAGGAIVHQLNLPCTGIVTSRNLAELPEDEALFWRGVHHRSEKLYKHPLFRAGISPRQDMVDYLSQPNNLLWVMLDVRETGKFVDEHPFMFMQQQRYLQTGPARLACLAKVPLIPMCIQYEPKERRHHLYFGTPIWPDKTPIEITQQAVTQIELLTASQPQQFFHDMNMFLEPHLR